MSYPTSKTLKEYFTGDIVHTENSTQWGYHLQMWDALENGESLITSNLATLQTSLRSNAVSGKSSFTISLETSYQVNNLKLKGPHFKSYSAGIKKALAEQGIYDYEVTVTLNTADSSVTKVDLAFNFTGA